MNQVPVPWPSPEKDVFDLIDMKYIVIIIVIFLLPLIVQVCKRMSNWLFEKLEHFISPLVLHPCTFCLISYIGYKTQLFSEGNDRLGFVPGIILVMYFMVGISLYYICEKAGELISKETNFWKFIISILIVLLSLSLSFSVQYYVLYLYNPDYFDNVPNSNCILEFLIFSFGVITNTTTSSILPNALVTKAIMCSEVLVSFIYLLVILANYGQIGKLLKKYQDGK